MTENELITLPGRSREGFLGEAVSYMLSLEDGQALAVRPSCKGTKAWTRAVVEVASSSTFFLDMETKSQTG